MKKEREKVRFNTLIVQDKKILVIVVQIDYPDLLKRYNIKIIYQSRNLNLNNIA